MKANLLPTWMALAAAGLLGFATPFTLTAQRKPHRRLTLCAHPDDECKACDYDDVSFDVPVSFSVTTHLPLSKRFSIGSGLACTFLTNSFRHAHLGFSEGATRLYYLGIPLTLSGNLLTSGRWTAYLSAGATVEKGLLKVRRFTSLCGHSTSCRSYKSSIHGFETSLSATVGLSFRLLGNWHSFLEQKLSYFFNTGQPLSAHTNDPFPHTLGLGLRYCF